MADPKHADPADIERVISLAIGAVGRPVGVTVLDWRRRVAELIPEIASMLEEQSPEYYTTKGVLTARVFRGTYRGYQLEDSSKRLVVSVEAFSQRSGKEGVETVRTERTDELAGQVMRTKLDLIKPGTEVRTYIAMDKLPNGNSARTLVNIVPLTMADRSAGNGAPAAPEPERPREPDAPSGAEDPSPSAPERSDADVRALLEGEGMAQPSTVSGGASIAEIVTRLKKAGKYVAFAKSAAMDHGISNVNGELTDREANELRKLAEGLLS